MAKNSRAATRLTVAAIALLFLASACHRPNKSSRHRPLQPCRLPGIEEELLCGKLTVPENRQTKVGRTIDLNVVVLPALDSRTKEEPLFELAGGPGAAATGAANFYAFEGREFRRRRDVVLVEQRGTGSSNPLTAEPKGKDPQDYLTEMYPIAYVENLRHTLERKADLTQYTTSLAMDDLDDVRAWLGYERINLFGLSYGTRAALVYLRQHGDHARSAVLMGAVPTYLKIPLHHASAAQRAMELLLEECARDAACNQAFPQLRQEWKELLARLQQEPARVAYASPDNSGEVAVEIRADIFAEKLRFRMYSPEGARQVPFLIHQAAHGDFAPFLKMIMDGSGPDFVADGMYLCVTCAEDTPFIDQEEAALNNAGNPFGNYRVFAQTRACSIWPQGKIPDDYHAPISSNVPVLIISGNMDPVGPPEWGEEVARYLPNSRHVIVPHQAHSPDGLTNTECLDNLVREFIAKGNSRDLDVDCLTNMLPPPFTIRAAE